MNERHDTALRYARVGWPVFPCHWTAGEACSCGTDYCASAGKHPLTRRGVLDASTDQAVIAAWWSRWPAANVAIATGAPGPDVLDFDVKDGVPGAASFDRLKAAGLLGGAFAMVSTWSGGWHLYYPGTEQGNGSIRGHGVDFRGRGGYVLAPPSSIRGAAYRIVEHRAPTWSTVRPVSFDRVRTHLAPRPTVRAMPGRQVDRDHQALIRHVGRLQPGNRNGGLFWAACRAAESGAGEDVYAELHAAAVSIGLPDREAAATIASARRREVRA